MSESSVPSSAPPNIVTFTTSPSQHSNSSHPVAAATTTTNQHSDKQLLYDNAEFPRDNYGFPYNPNHSTTTANDDVGDPQQDLKILHLEPSERPLGRPNRNAFRHLKKPPQPHMCIKDRTMAGEDLYINVMSWTRIMMPPSPEHPIPLYGGMKVYSGNSKTPQNIYAVMVNPEILKHVSRNCDDPEEKCALVELMSDFVEAMNPGLCLSRCPVILKDRDLTGELKDIWSAVQAKRERDKECQQPNMALYRCIEFGNEEANGKTEDGSGVPQTEVYLPFAIASQPESPSSSVDPVINEINASNAIIQMPTAIKVLSAPIATVESVDDTDGEKQLEKEPTLTSLSAAPEKSINKAEKSSSTSTKKDKLVGFLPNSCHNIFPFIKSKNGSSKKDKKAAKEVAAKTAAAGSSSPVKVVQNGNSSENGSPKLSDATKHESFVVGNGRGNETNGVHSKEEETVVVDKIQKIKL